MNVPTRILTRVAKNDYAAIHECVEAYGGDVWSLALRSTPSVEDAENTAAEIFMDVWRLAGKFESSGLGELAFIFAVARCRLRRLTDERPVYSISAHSDLTSSKTGLLLDPGRLKKE